jgi:hypothetical protein
VVVLLLLGYVEWSDGGVGGGLVCATTTPAAMSAATAKDAATGFMRFSDQFARTAEHGPRCSRRESRPSLVSP